MLGDIVFLALGYTLDIQNTIFYHKLD